MRSRRIGSTDLVVSEVGLAVWSLVAGPGARSDEDAADLLGAALDLGIAYFAATDSDDDGRAEELLGRAGLPAGSIRRARPARDRAPSTS